MTRELIPFDTMALAVWRVDAPRSDELLACAGLDPEQLETWCERRFREDPLFEQAMREGMAHANGQPRQPGRSLIAHCGQTVVIMLPESLREGRWWYLLLSRADRPYDERELRDAEWLLRHWQVAFDVASEPGLGRLLLGDDHRLLLSDLQVAATLNDVEEWAAKFSQTFRPLVDQRFPDLKDFVVRDFATTIGPHGFWIRFHRRTPGPGVSTGCWSLELRPLESQSLPAVDRVEDDRIARALAFLHAEYHSSPSLAEIARVAHMSPFHFHRLFSRDVGVSPKHYLQRLQLQVARWLLRASNEPIGEIASRAGFASHGHFTSTFHRVIGQSPSEYRQRVATGDA